MTVPIRGLTRGSAQANPPTALPIRPVPEPAANPQIGVNPTGVSHDRSNHNILASFSSAVAGIVAKAAPAIVSVHSHRARASGFVWKPGLVVTADEALAEEGEISIKLADGTARPATIVGRDHTTDMPCCGSMPRTSRRKLSPGRPRSVRSRSSSLRRAARPARRLGWCRWSAAAGAAFAAATSMRGSSSMSGCITASRAGSRSMLPAKPSAWPCWDRGASSYSGGHDRTRCRQARNPRPHRARLSRRRPADGRARRRRRRDGDERRQDGSSGRRRHQARRRDRRLE